ncbi:sensory box histidine kinase/response regulator [Parvularcula bermudensis HTCC2503]|uniref:histidine kinase n=1 Tax=Parvularcula bermudensis (strain ATCC BAA-594 / HTCC2503 / KCTC 12087) TaxID=314260 RepID=E0TGG9_PARBH|nr:ATP-binding protein [Parvularcula bermudensis]ADM09588.1 sensory box histidine kinase/response regulator [Parvularcula bermudensis HTCC2503]
MGGSLQYLIARPWADLPLTAKGLVVIALPLFILMGSLMMLHQASYAEARAEDDVRRAFAIQRDIYQVHALLAEAASGVRGYLLTGQDRFLEPFRRAEGELPETYARLDIAIEDPGVRAAYDVFLDQADQKREGLDALLAQTRQAGNDRNGTAEILQMLIDNKTVLDDLRAQIDVIQALEGALLDERRERVERVRALYLSLTVISALIGLMGSLAAVYLFSTGIVRRVQGLERNAERLERGEPMIAFPPASDEIGRLAEQLDRASELLRAREQAVRDSEERFRLVVEGVQDYGIFALTPEGEVASWNTGAERIKGWQADEILGKHFARFYPSETRGYLPTQMLERARDHGTAEDEGWRVRKDGSRFWANVIVTALRDEAGELRGFAKVTRDITERKQSEEALKAAREAAVLASQAKSEFLSRTSHELRTPMSAIIGFAQVLELDHDDLAPRHQTATTQILKAARHLLSLINDLLDVSSIEAGTQALKLEEVSLLDVLEEAYSLAAPIVKAANLSFQFDQESAQYTVQCDRRRTIQVVLNLLTNAAKYNREGAYVALTVQPDGNDVVVSVTDDGAGIPDERIPRLFTPFDRLGQEKQRRTDGSGLGLALSKSLVETMGGRIGFRNATPPDRGASFWFTLPISRAGRGPEITDPETREEAAGVAE